MELSKEQIADLESRGIKPGVKLRCPVNRHIEFTFGAWSEFEFDDYGDFSTVDTVDDRYLFLKCNLNRTGQTEYATPIE